jgi:hypothetical protein
MGADFASQAIAVWNSFGRQSEESASLAKFCSRRIENRTLVN